MGNVVIIDRRTNSRDDKHLTNRQRFLRRQKEAIKQAIKKAIGGGSVSGKYNNVEVEIHGTVEPGFYYGNEGGTDFLIAPGNQWFIKGDRFVKPDSEAIEDEIGGGGPGGEGEDSFTFFLSKDEFRRFFLEDLNLPDLVRKANHKTEIVATQRAGYKTEGTPAQLDYRRSATRALGRRLALRRPSETRMEEIRELLRLAEQEGDTEEVAKLSALLEEMELRQKQVPWIDPHDLQYRASEQVRLPVEKVVLFCLMDVSGSMGEREKDIAKRYFMLLLMLLEHHYGKEPEIVFVRHHSTAEECSEEDFFYKRESGGTVVSSGVELVHKIIKDRFPSDEYNIYVAQASDGDNWTDDNPVVQDIVENHILPVCQYYTYIDIPYAIDRWGSSTLWPLYSQIASTHPNLAARQIGRKEDILHVFAELFKKRTTKKTTS